MKYLTNIWNFLNSKVFMYILIIIGIIIFISMYSSNGNLKDEIDLNNKNITALNDTVKNIKLRNGDLESSIQGFQGSVENLEILNESLAYDIKKEKGKVVTYSNIIFSLKQTVKELEDALEGAIYNDPVATSDTSWNIDWKLPYIYDSLNYDIFLGRTQVSLSGKTLKHTKTFLINRDSQIKLTWGQKYENDKLKVFVRTSHPAFKTQMMEGMYVDLPEKKHWFQGFGVGPQVGISIYPKQTLYLGVGIQYNVYQW